MIRRWYERMVLCVLLAVLMLIGGAGAGFAASSAVVTADGYACMGVDKSQRQTEQEARADAKRNAVERARTLVKSQTTVKDLQVAEDIVAAYAQAAVTVLEELKDGTGWYDDKSTGRCFKSRIKAEVVPDEKAMNKAAAGKDWTEDPAAPLTVGLWTDRQEYRQGEKVRIFIRGNRPFYARILYRDAEGRTLQLLPNPYRTDNYFRGGVTYEIPEGERDRFALEISPPFGKEELVLHAATAPLGDLDLETTGGVYTVKTRARDLGIKSRGLSIKVMGGPQAAEGPQKEPAGGIFVEKKAEVKTKP